MAPHLLRRFGEPQRAIHVPSHALLRRRQRRPVRRAHETLRHPLQALRFAFVVGGKLHGFAHGPLKGPCCCHSPLAPQPVDVGAQLRAPGLQLPALRGEELSDGTSGQVLRTAKGKDLLNSTVFSTAPH